MKGLHWFEFKFQEWKGMGFRKYDLRILVFPHHFKNQEVMMKISFYEVNRTISQLENPTFWESQIFSGLVKNIKLI